MDKLEHLEISYKDISAIDNDNQEIEEAIGKLKWLQSLIFYHHSHPEKNPLNFKAESLKTLSIYWSPANDSVMKEFCESLLNFRGLRIFRFHHVSCKKLSGEVLIQFFQALGGLVHLKELECEVMFFPQAEIIYEEIGRTLQVLKELKKIKLGCINFSEKPICEIIIIDQTRNLELFTSGIFESRGWSHK